MNLLARILRVEDLPPIPLYDKKGYKKLIIDDKCGAKEIGGVLVVRPPGALGKQHYHRKREKVWFILAGTATLLIEGKEYQAGPDTMIFIAPNEKHKLMNKSDTELRLLEFFSHPEDWPFVEGEP